MSVSGMQIRRTGLMLSVHGLVTILLAVSPEAGLIPIGFASLALPAWGLIFFTVFYLKGQEIRPRPWADAVTGARLLMGTAIFLAARSGVLGSAISLIAVLAVELADGLDGWLARKYGPTVFGGIYDMEIDAFTIMLLAAATSWYGGLPGWVLIPGLIRYFFFYPFILLKPPGSVFPKSLSLYSKTICVATVFCLASAWYLPSAAETAIAITAILLGASFVWETVFYIVSRTQVRNL